MEEEISTVLMVDVDCETNDCLWMMDKAERFMLCKYIEVGQLKEDKHRLQAEVTDLKKSYKVLHYLLKA